MISQPPLVRDQAIDIGFMTQLNIDENYSGADMIVPLDDGDSVYD